MTRSHLLPSQTDCVRRPSLWILAMAIMSLTLVSGCISFSLLPGRPLKIDNEPICAEVCVDEKSNWARGPHPDTTHLDDATRVALEALWLQDALGEHASIPAFSRISWQLAMVGAPPELLERAHKAALDEINHARLSFAIAEGYGGRSYSVQPIPKMQKGGFDLTNSPIEEMITETIFDGCLVEGFFAKTASIAAAQCQEPATRAVLEQIARDELSHAVFSWELLEWLLQQYPTQVRTIIENSCDALKTYPRPILMSKTVEPLVKKANPESLIAHGRIPEEQWLQIWSDHRQDMQHRLKELLK